MGLAARSTAQRREADETVIIPHDPVNEQVVLAAACVDLDVRERLSLRVRAEHFAAPEHRAVWEVLMEMERRKLGFDPATVQKLAGDKVDHGYLDSLLTARPEAPPNLDYHVECLFWDHARLTAISGPVAGLLKGLRNPRESPDRVKALARQVAMSFDGYQDRAYLLDANALVHAQVAEIRQRMEGHACYPFGLEGLDFDADGTPRMVPGAKPGMVTVITGVSGAGKSTLTARIVLGLARLRRRVLVGAWEMTGGMTLELLACMSLGYSRTAFMTGNVTEEELGKLQMRMEQISQYVKFMANPFRRSRGEKPSNERNLDVIQGYIADSGCEVFVADLWRRCLKDDDVGEEEFALYRQQAMAEEMKVHCILVQQQKLKEVEQRSDKRPTRECIMGSSAWVQVADTIIGANRPALWKNLDDNVFECHILKQRWGKWPILIEFDWNGDAGSIAGGRTVPYDHPGDTAAGGGVFEPPRKRRGGFRGRD